LAPRRSLRSPVRVLNFYCLGLSSCVAHAIEAKKGGKRAELDGRSKAAFSAGRRQPQETRGGGSGVVEAKHYFEANQSASQPGLQCLPRRFFLGDIASRPFPILMQQNKRTGRARGLNEEEFWLRRHRRGRKQKTRLTASFDAAPRTQEARCCCCANDAGLDDGAERTATAAPRPRTWSEAMRKR